MKRSPEVLERGPQSPGLDLASLLFFSCETSPPDALLPFRLHVSPLRDTNSQAIKPVAGAKIPGSLTLPSPHSFHIATLYPSLGTRLCPPSCTVSMRPDVPWAPCPFPVGTAQSPFLRLDVFGSWELGQAQFPLLAAMSVSQVPQKWVSQIVGCHNAAPRPVILLFSCEGVSRGAAGTSKGG